MLQGSKILAGLRSRNLILIVSQEGQNANLLFNSDITNYLLKTNGGRDKRPNLFFGFFCCCFFVVWSALVGSIVVAWSRKLHLGSREIASLLIASAKILDHVENKSLSSFYGQLPNY